MLDEAFVEELLNGILRRELDLLPERYEIIPLLGDASNRKYYRLRPATPAGAKSIILMELAEAEDFKKSEEKVTTSRVPVKELPYINILRHLETCQVAVPKLYYYEKEKGLLFLEDLGDITLREELDGCDPAAYRPYYVLAIEELLKIQIQGTRLENPDCIAFGRAFDMPLLMWEFDHFLEYGVEEGHAKKMDPKDRHRCRSLFEEIAQSLAMQPRYLTHRDFHSRNLMIQDGKIRVLDFQDALMGPAQYDLASLLRDSYLSLSEELVQELLTYYLDRKESLEGITVDRKEFIRLFDLMSVQRNLKACGRFAYIHTVKHNPNYLPYISPTLKNVRSNLAKYPELHDLRNLLKQYVEGLK
jgi:N-acetylmuramate 1-kinase